MDFQCGYIVEPDLDMYKFLSTDRNPANYGRYKDPVLDKLYDEQSRATDPRSASRSCGSSRSGCSTRRCTT